MPVSDQGSLSNRYKFISRTLVFLTFEDEILLIKGASNKRLWAGLYNGIGGHVERGENIFRAAKREILEETGIQIDALKLCGVITIDVELMTGIMIFVFHGESPIKPDHSSTEGQTEWIQIDELPELPLVEDLPVLLPLILDMKKNDPPFAAHYNYSSNGELNIEMELSDNELNPSNLNQMDAQ